MIKGIFLQKILCFHFCEMRGFFKNKQNHKCKSHIRRFKRFFFFFDKRPKENKKKENWGRRNGKKGHPEPLQKGRTEGGFFNHFSQKHNPLKTF